MRRLNNKGTRTHILQVLVATVRRRARRPFAAHVWDGAAGGWGVVLGRQFGASAPITNVKVRERVKPFRLYVGLQNAMTPSGERARQQKQGAAGYRIERSLLDCFVSPSEVEGRTKQSSSVLEQILGTDFVPYWRNTCRSSGRSHCTAQGLRMRWCHQKRAQVSRKREQPAAASRRHR